MKIRAYRSFDEALSEIEREANVRERCFPGWIEDGRINRIDAQDRFDRLITALMLLEAVSPEERIKLEASLQAKEAQE